MVVVDIVLLLGLVLSDCIQVLHFKSRLSLLEVGVHCWYLHSSIWFTWPLIKS